jgi:hypothetical protein
MRAVSSKMASIRGKKVNYRSWKAHDSRRKRSYVREKEYDQCRNRDYRNGKAHNLSRNRSVVGGEPARARWICNCNSGKAYNGVRKRYYLTGHAHKWRGDAKSAKLGRNYLNGDAGNLFRKPKYVNRKARGSIKSPNYTNAGSANWAMRFARCIRDAATRHSERQLCERIVA